MLHSAIIYCLDIVNDVNAGKLSVYMPGIDNVITESERFN